MPRKKKSPSPAADSGPVELSAILPELPAAKAILAARDGHEAVAKPPEHEQAAPEPSPPSATEPEIGPHTAAVLASRPFLGPVPTSFIATSSDRQAGIRVNRKNFRDKDGFEKSIAAIQFAEDRLPTRAEKDVLEKVGQADDGQHFTFKPESRQWTRIQPEGWSAGENTIDAHRVMTELAKGRNEGHGR